MVCTHIRTPIKSKTTKKRIPTTVDPRKGSIFKILSIRWRWL